MIGQTISHYKILEKLGAGGMDINYLRNGLYVVDRDGRRRSEIVSPSEEPDFPKWSPDGQWLAYSASAGRSWDPDSVGIYLVEGTMFSAPRQIGRGVCMKWRDSRHLLFTRGPRTWEIDITTGTERPFFTRLRIRGSNPQWHLHLVP